MSKISYFNGNYQEHASIKVSVDDRGFVFGDGIYEVIMFNNGNFIDIDAHYARFKRTCAFMNFGIGHNRLPATKEALIQICNQLQQQNNIRDTGYFYIQVTRGELGSRAHNAPANDLGLSFLVTISEPVVIQKKWMTDGISCITTPDIRWQRRDVKTIQLLPNIRARQMAMDVGADDAIFIDGVVTEATAANLFIVNSLGELQTHPKTNKILGGITRYRVIELAKKNNIIVNESVFGVDELFNAKEVFLTNSNSRIRPVTKIDGRAVADGKIGAVCRNIFNLYEEFIESQLRI